MYNTNKSPDITWYFPIDRKAKIISAADVPIFKIIYFINQCIIFFTRLISFIFKPLFYLYWASKTFPIGTVLSLGLANIFYHLWLHRLFKWITVWNARFNIDKIFIVVFTCKVYIGFILFVGVSTCSVQLILSISRTQLFNKIIYSIQGLLLFLIRSEQFNYFFIKNFNPILQITTIWKITPPNIFQVFRE